MMMKTMKAIRAAALVCAATLGLTAFGATYTWTGGGTPNGDGSYNWNAPANWSWDGEGDPTAAPGEGDTVVIGTGAAVTITGSSGDRTGTVTISRNVTLTGAFVLDTIATDADASGVALTLNNVDLSQGTGYSIDSDVVISGLVKNTINATLRLNGKVTGNGTIRNTGTNYTAGFMFYGDVTEFAGDYKGYDRNGAYSGWDRDNTYLAEGKSSSANAVWTLGYRYNSSKQEESVLGKDGETYRFGQLSAASGSGFSLKGRSNVVMEIGALNTDSAVSFHNVGTGNAVTKVGTGNLSLKGAIAALNVNAGKVTLTDSTEIPAAITMQGGATIAFADDLTSSSALISVAEEQTAGVSVEVASGKTVILADTFLNSVGFTATGAGTLELTGVPAWTGTTKVSGAGTLIVPNSATLSLDADTTASIAIPGDRLMLYNKNEVNVWTGLAGDKKWFSAGNWSKGTIPAADEVVIIPETNDETLKITVTANGNGQNSYTGYLTIMRDVTIARTDSSTTWQAINITSVSGTGTLTLEGGDGSNNAKHLFLAGTTPYTINTDLTINGSVYNNTSSVLTLNGALLGDGNITHANNNGTGYEIHGDTSAFTGTYVGGRGNSHIRDSTRLRGSARGSELAEWQFGYYATSTYSYPIAEAGTYKFGRLTTQFATSNSTNYLFRAHAQNVVVEVGAIAGKTSTVGGTLEYDSNVLRKVGDTSVLNLTLTEAKGLVEAEAGTLNLLGKPDGTGFAPVSLTITGKGATVVVADTVTVDSGEEDDPDTTEVDESKAAFVPVLSEALTAAYCKLLATPGDGVTTYTLGAVAQVGENTYPTIADAVAAATGDDKAITLLQSTAEPVVLTTLGQTLTLGGFTCGAVSAVTGLGVKEEDGVYTAQDNSSATWQGDAAGASWTDGSNWSTGYAPDSATAVTIPATEVEGGWLIYIGGDAQAKSLAVLGNATLQRDASISHNGCIVVQESITTGETLATLTLNSSFIFAGASEVSISCPIVCANGNSTKTSGFTSNTTGTFAISSTITGTGTLEFRKAVTLSQDLDVVEGLTVKFDGINPTFTNDAVLKGEGTVVFTVEPASPIQTMLRQASKWTGVCELKSVSKSAWNFGSYGNTSSTVRLNGVTGYMGFNSNTSPKNDATVKVLDIASGGLTLGDSYHSKTIVFDAAKVTGSGAIKIGTQSNVSTASSVTKYVFTGDMSEFTGTLDFGTLSSYRPEIIIATSSSNLPTPTDYGQIIVAEGATAYVNNTWTAPGAMVVAGNVVMGASGAIAGDNGVAGAGTITYSTFPTAAPAFRSETLTSGIGTIPAWTGTVELPARNGSGSIALAPFGVSGSKIVLNGITGQDANSIYLANSNEITATVELKGLLKLTNGSTGANYTFAEVTGEGNMFLSATGSPGSPYYTYTFTKLTDYTGEINAVKTSDSKYAALAIGTVAVSSWTLGQKMVDLSDNCNLTTSPGSITVEVNGSSLDNHHLFKASDGDLYVIAAQVTVDETTTYFATLEAAAEFALANDAQIAKVDAATPTELPGWSYDKGYFTKLDIAQVGETTYKTLAAAIATGTTDDIVLIADCAETVTLGEGQTIKPGSYAFSGVLKGTGTIYYAAKPTTVPTFEDWTGTFVADWDGAHATSFPANDYGILGSVVEVRKLGGGFVPLPGSENVDRTVLPTISIPEGCFMKLANGYSNYKTTFTKVTGAGTMTNNTYTIEIATLENFTGEISSDVGTKIVAIVTSTAITPGTCLVKGGTFTDVASTTVNGSTPSVALTVKTGNDAGIYFDPVASITVDEVTTYYNTLQEAVDAVGNNVITVLKAGGTATLPVGSVKIANTELEYTATYPEGAYYTKTTAGEEYTTYLCRAAAASASIGGNVSYYSTVQDAYTAVNVNGAVGDSFTVLDGSFSSEIDGYSYNAETHTYTKLATVAQVQVGVNTYSYTTLAAACAGADTYEVTTVTLLVARDTIDETIPTGWVYNTPEASDTTYGTLTKQSGIDPTTPGSSYASTAMTEADAITAAKAAIVVPAGASVEAADYAEYFTYGVAGDAGAYTVTIAGLSDEVVVDPVETSAIGALQAEADGEGKVTVTVKPGLYYGFVAGDSPTLADPAEYTLAMGTSMTFEKPIGTGKGFVKVVISPSPKE